MTPPVESTTMPPSESPLAGDEVLDLLRSHRSIREFTAEPLEEDLVRTCVAAAQCAATSSHVQSAGLLRVTDARIREQLVELTGGQAYVAAAPAFFVVYADQRRHGLISKLTGHPHAQNLETFVLNVVDATLFAQNLIVAFEGQGLGTCCIGGLRNDLPEVDRILGLPAGVLPLFGLCVGRPAQDPDPKPRLPVEAMYSVDRLPDEERVLADIAEHDTVMATYYRGRGLEGRNWSGGLARKFGEARRRNLRDYYESKGARFDGTGSIEGSS